MSGDELKTKQKGKTLPLSGRDQYVPKPGQSERFEAIRNGDAEAFSAYYIDFTDPLIRFLTPLLGDLEDAKEVTQEVFASLWENHSQIEPSKSLNSLVYLTARRMAYKFLRSRGIHSKYENEQCFTAEEFDFSADEALITKETSELIDTVLDDMPPQRRRVFEAHRFEGKSYDEIAKELNISSETVRKHVQTASKTVKEALKVCLLFLLTY